MDSLSGLTDFFSLKESILPHPPIERRRAKPTRSPARHSRRLPGIPPALSSTTQGGPSLNTREGHPLPAKGQRSEKGMASPLSRFMRTAAIPSFGRANFSFPVSRRLYNDDIRLEAYRPRI